MRVYLESLGCKLNQSEMETLARQFVAAGHELVASAEAADLCILNTCAVTHVAARKSRQTAHRLRRLNPDARLVITGCYAEVTTEPLEADLTVGNEDKARLLDLIRSAGFRLPETGHQQPVADTRPPVARTRAFVKIQDGCDNACTYCIVHVARGRQRSRPRDAILEEIRALVAEGYKEIVLTGVHVGAYGRDAGGASQGDLRSLVTAILTETDVPRLRLSSIEPWDISPDFFDLWQNPRLCRHLHLPLQSGCDATLRRMGRRYTTTTFAQIVAAAREAIPGLAITTDIIVGFRGGIRHQLRVRHPNGLRQAARFSLLNAARHTRSSNARPGAPHREESPCQADGRHRATNGYPVPTGVRRSDAGGTVGTQEKRGAGMYVVGPDGQLHPGDHHQRGGPDQYPIAHALDRRDLCRDARRSAGCPADSPTAMTCSHTPHKHSVYQESGGTRHGVNGVR